METTPGKDLRPTIAKKVIQADFDLLELRNIDLSLEDVFLELTSEEPVPPTTDDSEEA